MNIRILGTGGFDNEGLPCNAYLIDGHALVETPPDILQSLHREGIALSAIDTVVLTHYHGDHCFGLPFFIFNLARMLGDSPARPLRLAGPEGLRVRAEQLLSLAISPQSSYLDWFRRNVRLTEIGPGTVLDLGDGSWMRFLPAEHTVPTFAILAGKGPSDGVPLFASTADTVWGAKAAAVFTSGARLILCDANGNHGVDPAGIDAVSGANLAAASGANLAAASGSGRGKAAHSARPGAHARARVHMSPEDIVNLGLPLVGRDVTVVGTHLSTDRNPAPAGLKFAKAGDVFDVN